MFKQKKDIKIIKLALMLVLFSFLVGACKEATSNHENVINEEVETKDSIGLEVKDTNEVHNDVKISDEEREEEMKHFQAATYYCPNMCKRQYSEEPSTCKFCKSQYVKNIAKPNPNDPDRVKLDTL